MMANVREDLFRSLNKLSIAGTLIMSFVAALVTLSYLGITLGASLLLSLFFSTLVTLSRIVREGSFR